ncbi:MAG: hypothetical protein ACOCQY_05045 [Halorhabdus sp.]
MVDATTVNPQVQSGEGGLAETVARMALQGQLEYKRIRANVGAQGVRETAREELQTEREYFADRDDGVGAAMLRAGQTGGRLVSVMITIVIAAAVGFVGTTVISSIDDSIDAPDDTEYANASDSIGEGFADAMGLTDVVFLVLMASVVLGALLAFRGAR